MDPVQNSPESRIVVCVTTSPHAVLVLTAGRDLAASLGAEVIALHAGADTAENREALSIRLKAAGVETWIPELLIEDGRADEVVCQVAQLRGAGLIVAGALEQESVVRDLLGSTARRLARRAPCSVLLVVGSDVGFRRVVMALDRSRTSAAALEFLARISGRGGMDELHLMFEQPRTTGVESPTIPVSVQDISSELYRIGLHTNQALLDDFSAAVSGGRLRIVLGGSVGSGGAGLEQYAQEVRADLVVVPASTRKMGLWERFFGHPANALLQHLPCSLLLYRADSGDENR